MIKKGFVCFENVRRAFGKVEGNRTGKMVSRIYMNNSKEFAFPQSCHGILTLFHLENGGRKALRQTAGLEDVELSWVCRFSTKLSKCLFSDSYR